MKEVLLIAEDPAIISSFTSMLSPVYSVCSVTSEQMGIEALKRDYSNMVAVLIELKLARKSNFAFAEQMQAYSSFSSIPMIAISGAFPDDDDMDCIEHGFFDLIAATSPRLLVHQRIGNAIRAKDSLSLTEVEKMLKELPACIFLKDSDGKYVFSTQTWHHLDTGGDPNWTIRGKTDLDIRKDKDNAKKAMEADRRILETGKGTEYIIEENQDGIREYLQLIKRPVYDENGRVNGIIALINDITDYQLLKLELERRAKTDADMVTAMAADYRSIYYANLDRDECLCVRASSKQDGHMWKGKTFPFFEGFAEYAERYVAESAADYSFWMYLTDKRVYSDRTLGRGDSDALRENDEFEPWMMDGRPHEFDDGRVVSYLMSGSEGFNYQETSFLSQGMDSSDDSDYLTAVEDFLDVLRDYVDTDDLRELDGMEADDYADAGYPTLPRNGAPLFRAELYWLRGSEVIPCEIAPIPPSGVTLSRSGASSDGAGNGGTRPSFFSASDALIARTLNELDEEEISEVLEARRRWREEGVRLDESLSEELYSKVSAAFSFTESSVVAISVTAADAEGEFSTFYRLIRFADSGNSHFFADRNRETLSIWERVIE